MSGIVAINGSPKARDSASGQFIAHLEDRLGQPITVYQATRLARREDAWDALSDIAGARVLLLVFPLYVDGLPAPLIRFLSLLEQAVPKADTPPPVVYALCNCGFYEGEQTRPALRMARSFAQRAGYRWGYGVGVGAGGMLAGMVRAQGPGAGLYTVLNGLCRAIQQDGETGQDVFVSPGIPRFVYLLGGHWGWRRAARRNGVTRQLAARPHGRREE